MKLIFRIANKTPEQSWRVVCVEDPAVTPAWWYQGTITTESEIPIDAPDIKAGRSMYVIFSLWTSGALIGGYRIFSTFAPAGKTQIFTFDAVSKTIAIEIIDIPIIPTPSPSFLPLIIAGIGVVALIVLTKTRKK